jgi:hypothetical protein
MGTKNNPGAFDCYKNADPDEPMFILLGRDDRAPSLVEAWADASEKRGTAPAKIAEARECAANMRRWRDGLPKLPPLCLWNNETDTYVARSAEHATELYEKTIGEKYDVDELGEWVKDMRPLDAEMTIHCDEPPTKTIAEWIAENPEGGMLCSTEY